MKTPSFFRPSFLLSTGAALLLAASAHAQIAAGRDKFLGNVTGNSIPANFDTYWNQITPENASKWGSVEATRNTMNWAALDTAYQHARTKGYKFKLHTLVWGSQYPTWITGLTQTELRAEIEEWMNALAARYPDVWAIDVVNEPIKTPLNGNIAVYKNALGGDGATGWDWVITSFQLARAKFPNAKLILNEYGTENDPPVRATYKAIITLLKDRNLIDGIGIQAHYFNVDNMNAASVKAMLDDYATLGLDVYVTELDITGASSQEGPQLAKYQDVFPAMWEHASVKGVTLWGYVVGQTWRDNTGIVNADGTERAAMSWLKGYVTGTLSIPSALTATAASSSQINLAWLDTAANETGFKVEQATAGAGPWTEIAGSVAANSTTYSVTGLSASTTYYFRIRAANAAGNSAYTTTASATTSAAPAPPPPPPPSGGGGGGGGGGGAPSTWFLAALASLALLRRGQRR
jgi:endo-1,4-beta-xylanase